MKTTDQGTREPSKSRYQAIPRTLILLTSNNPQTGEQEILLLKGAPTFVFAGGTVAAVCSLAGACTGWVLAGVSGALGTTVVCSE